MSIFVSGAAGAVSGVNPTITLPAHASGDMILLGVSQGDGNPPVPIPPAGGTVPTWNLILSGATGGGNAWTLQSVYAIATAVDHTAGTWSGAWQLVSLVLRSTSGGLVLGQKAQLAANNVAAINFPAVSGTDGSSGTSMGVRFASRNLAASGVEQNVPALNGVNWSGNATSLSGAFAVLAIKTFANVSGPITSGTITTAGAGGDYRSHTIEVMEAPLSGVIPAIGGNIHVLAGVRQVANRGPSGWGF